MSCVCLVVLQELILSLTWRSRSQCIAKKIDNLIFIQKVCSVFAWFHTLYFFFKQNDTINVPCMQGQGQKDIISLSNLSVLRNVLVNFGKTWLLKTVEELERKFKSKKIQPWPWPSLKVKSKKYIYLKLWAILLREFLERFSPHLIFQIRPRSYAFQNIFLIENGCIRKLYMYRSFGSVGFFELTRTIKWFRRVCPWFVSGHI